MEKKFQVFVSSTYEDLKSERQEVMRTLLRLECIPMGMELFPASNEDVWTLITQVIDDCDYYIVIVGDRYGFTDETGMSYTEKEYRYAIEKNIPTLAFLRLNQVDTSGIDWHEDAGARERLEKFKEFAKQKFCRHWALSEGLCLEITYGLNDLKKRKPAIGWIKGDQVPSSVQEEILGLRRKIDKLESDLSEAKTQPPAGTENLSQGDDPLIIAYTISYVGEFNEFRGFTHSGTVTRSTDKNALFQTNWNRLFSVLAPPMLTNKELSELQVVTILKEYILNYETEKIESLKPSGYSFDYIEVGMDIIRSILIQFRALGLIKEDNSQASVRWLLTPYGDSIMMQLRAVKKGATSFASSSPST